MARAGAAGSAAAKETDSAIANQLEADSRRPDKTRLVMFTDKKMKKCLRCYLSLGVHIIHDSLWCGQRIAAAAVVQSGLPCRPWRRT